MTKMTIIIPIIAMALVAYDNSDSSEYEDDEGATSAILVTNERSNNVKQDANKIIEDESTTENERDDSLFNRLPQPSSGKITIVEEDDEFLHKKASPSTAPKPKHKITIPSLSDFKDVEDTVTTTKPKTTNGKKSGLLSMLPQPKNGFSTSSTSLIPNSVKQKPQTSSVKKKDPLPSPKVVAKPSTLIEYSDESDEEVQNDFFSINKPVEAFPDDIPLDIEASTKKNTQTDTSTTPRSIESYFKKEEIVNEIPQEDYIPFSSEPMETNNVAESSSNEVALDEEAILKLCGTRGKRKHEEIQIIDINQQEVLNDAREMLLKGLMDDTSTRQSASKKRGNEPTSQQRRKHQITYLAHQAKANEAELQNQWANNRMTKRKTQSKYGF